MWASLDQKLLKELKFGDINYTELVCDNQATFYSIRSSLCEPISFLVRSKKNEPFLNLVTI